MAIDARPRQRVSDRFARCAAATADEPLPGRSAQHTEPSTQVVPALKPHIDVSLARIALEQIEDK
jgi:hypothetical protein